jgi:hypothetical protein
MSLKNEVEDIRQNQAPRTLLSIKERHQAIRIGAADWDRFLLKFSGDVDATVATKVRDVVNGMKLWKGAPPTVAVDGSGAFLSEATDPARTSLAVLEAEISRGSHIDRIWDKIRWD